MLEIKHIVRQLLVMRNRGQATGMPYENEPLVLAKASVSPAIRFKAGITAAERKALENDYMIQLYLGRTYETKTVSRPFVSVRAQYVAGLDFIRQSREVRLNLEFDFKNRPVAPYMAMVQGQPHIAFKTVPWQTVDEAQRARVIFDQWRRRHCLKDLSDWQDWIEFYRFTVACDANRQKGVSRGINYTAEGPVGVLRRLFLRAYTQQAFGLVPTLSYGELAAWLTASGYATTSDEVKNAKRAKLVEHVVPQVAAVTVLMLLLQEKFPVMEGGKFLAPSLM